MVKEIPANTTTRAAAKAARVRVLPADDFSGRVLAWFDRHGRTDLPWQKNPSAYRVWVSEIMLQQTQVSTVIGYYDRFMQRFPDVHALANASTDEVLHLWTGLGYYARARNLQRAARRVVAEFGGEFPLNAEVLAELPGIGRSTAGAIVALSSGLRAVILDGNVKRVLARFHAVAGDKNSADAINALWAHAESHTPSKRVADYTQAMMDLGATVCTRSKPRCIECPLSGGCVARAQGNPQDYPGRKSSAKITPVRAATLLLLRDAEGRVLLEQRPPSGLWGGLWCFPQCDTEPGSSLPESALTMALQQRALREQARAPLPSFRHTFSHFHLDIEPLLLDVMPSQKGVRENPPQAWVVPESPGALGLAAPVVKLLTLLAQNKSATVQSQTPDTPLRTANAKSRRRKST